MDAVAKSEGMRAALAALCALVPMGACWFLAGAALDTGEHLQKDVVLSAVFGAALVCVYVAALAAIARVPDRTLAVAAVAIAVPLVAPGEYLVPLLALAVAVVAAAGAIALASEPWEPELQRGLIAQLAAAAALLLVATALAIEPSSPSGREVHRIAAPQSEREVHLIASPPSERKADPFPSPVSERGDLAAGPADFVRGYYAALRRGDFERAWGRLGPRVRASFGGFEAWAAGFETTVSQRLTDVAATVSGSTATVTLILHATDRGACGRRVRRRFAQTWTLTRSRRGWHASAARGRTLSARPPSDCV